jgi:tRNA(Ile)-lysidine synthase
MLVKSGGDTLIVAHFDHGIRETSAEDARFVRGLAHRYGLTFETERVELGPGTSEETARSRRYAFLRRIAATYDGTIVTAHHQNDVIETIAINISRGTGWRGLAVLNDPTIERPLLTYEKARLYDYALQQGLEWVEDETNRSNRYLRNRLRAKLGNIDPATQGRLIALYDAQRKIAGLVDGECQRLVTTSRYFMTMIDESVSSELLRAWLANQALALTRPQRQRLLHAIKSAKQGDIVEPGAGVRVAFTKRDFIVKHPL